MQNYVLTLTITIFYIDFKYILVLFRCSLLLILTWKYQTVQLALLVFFVFFPLSLINLTISWFAANSEMLLTWLDV